MPSDDLLLAVVRFAPLLFIVGGVLIVGWLSSQHPPADWQSDVLAALSDSEALPAGAIRYRPPLDNLDVDLDSLVRVLDDLRGAGLVVRWYERTDVGRLPVYRRIRSGTAS